MFLPASRACYWVQLVKPRGHHLFQISAEAQEPSDNKKDRSEVPELSSYFEVAAHNGGKEACASIRALQH